MLRDAGNILFVSLLLVWVSWWIVLSSFGCRTVGVEKLLELGCVDVLYTGSYGFGVGGVSLFASSGSDAVVVGKDQAWQGQKEFPAVGCFMVVVVVGML